VGRRPATLAVVAFRDEERGCNGSRALVRSDGLPGFFVELHHEQGHQLARADRPVSVVTGIVGYARGWKTITGRAGHAGTTPMDARDDALLEAAAEFLRIRDVASRIEGAVATVGQVAVEPGGANVIPDRVGFSIDARAPDSERLDRLVAEIDVVDPQYVAPCRFSDVVCDAVRRSVEEVGLAPFEIVSGAGHDAGIMQEAGVQAGMVFVRAQNGGVSHSPDELAIDEDISLAVDVLSHALGRLAGCT
jgi:hydantoinase/carbamoylase family amidase